MFSSYRNKAEPPLFETTRRFKFFPRLTPSHPGIFFIQSSLFATSVCWILQFHRSNLVACIFSLASQSSHFLTVPYVHPSQWTAGSERRQSAAEAAPALLSLLSITSLLSAWTAQHTHSWTLFPPEFTLHSFSGIHFLHILALSFFHSQENWSFYSISPFPSFHSFPLKNVCMVLLGFFPCEI